MIRFTDLTGLAGYAVAFSWAVVALPAIASLEKRHRVLLACAVAIAVMLPIGELPPAAYVRGVTGDLSVTSLVLLLLAMARALYVPPSSKESKAPAAFQRTLAWGKNHGEGTLLLLVVIAALALYPLALGIGAKDPYRLGYGDPWFLLVLLAIALAAISRRLPVVALVVPLAVLAWGVGWYESTNLWDYLLDPLVAIYGVGVLMKLLARQLRLVRQPPRK